MILNKFLNRFFLVILGPTGVGKTDFVEELAKALSGKVEIINADMGQLYSQLSIGTAKPDINSSAIEANKYHMFNRIDKPINFTAFNYRLEILEIMEQVWKRGNLPILVGGSGFYVKSIFFPPIEQVEQVEQVEQIEQAEQIEQIELKEQVKSKLESAKLIQDDYESNLIKEYAKFNNLELWNLLALQDATRAKKLHHNDRYRVERALILLSRPDGFMASQLKPKFQMPNDTKCGVICLLRDRQELYTRINSRVNAMFSQGWLQEVLSLKNNINNEDDWYSFLKKKKLIGYAEIIDYINSKNNFEKNLELKELVSNISQKTRAYAKRQITFWRSLKEQLLEAENRSKPEDKYISFCQDINLTSTEASLCIDLIRKKLLIN